MQHPGRCNKFVGLLVLTQGISTGCSQPQIFRADDLEYPISMTPYIHNQLLEVVDTSGYDVTATFSIVRRQWSLGLLQLSSDTIDISEEVNKLCRSNEADGIVSCSFTEPHVRPHILDILVTQPLVFLSAYSAYQHLENSCFLYQYFGILGAGILTRILICPESTPVEIKGKLIRFHSRW